MKLLKSIVLAIALLTIALPTTVGSGVLGHFYTWVHALPVSNTSVDSTFTYRWESVTVYADTVELMLRIGAPDTASWSSREWLYIPKGGVLYFGPTNKLRRLEYKTVTGTGMLYMFGTKKRSMY